VRGGAMTEVIEEIVGALSRRQWALVGLVVAASVLLAIIVVLVAA